MTASENQFTGRDLAEKMRVVIPWLQANSTRNIQAAGAVKTGQAWLDAFAHEGGTDEAAIRRLEQATPAEMQHHDFAAWGEVLYDLYANATVLTLEQGEAIKAAQAEEKKKKLYTYAAIGGVALMGLFTFLYFRGKKT